MSAWSFLRTTLLSWRSPACLWRHPAQAVRVLAGAARNFALAAGDRLWSGRGLACPVCGWRGRSFRTFLSADEVIPRCICPGCGSFDRQRHLILGIRAELTRRQQSPPQTLLGFSVSPALRQVLRQEGLARCFRSDLAVGDDRFAPDFVGDLRRAPVGDRTVDWIFCSHVLEHVAELDDCLAELARLLRPGGAVWIQVPFEPGLACSRRIPIDPHRAHAHAWQFGTDFGSLIRRQGWTVEEVVAGAELDAATAAGYGIDPDERYWLVRKD